MDPALEPRTVDRHNLMRAADELGAWRIQLGNLLGDMKRHRQAVKGAGLDVEAFDNAAGQLNTARLVLIQLQERALDGAVGLEQPKERGG